MKCIKCGRQSNDLNFCWHCFRILNAKNGLNFNEIEEVKNLIRECSSIESLIDRDGHYSYLLRLSQKSEFASMYERDISENKEHIVNLDTIGDIKNKLNYILEQLKLGRIDLRPFSLSDITKNYLQYRENLDRTKKYFPTDIEILNLYRVVINLFMNHGRKNIILFPKKVTPLIKAGDETPSKIYTTKEITNPDIVRKPNGSYFSVPNTTMKEFTDKSVTPYEASEIIWHEFKDNWDELVKSQKIEEEIESIGLRFQLRNIVDKYN